MTTPTNQEPVPVSENLRVQVHRADQLKDWRFDVTFGPDSPYQANTVVRLSYAEAFELARVLLSKG